MDPIGNLITAIRNAELAGHSELKVRFASQSLAVLEVLQKNGYILSFEKIDDANKPSIAIQLLQPVVRHHYKRISKPGRRLYTAASKIPIVLRGLGIVVLSTPKGIMTGKEAKKASLGGEVMFEAY